MKKQFIKLVSFVAIALIALTGMAFAEEVINANSLVGAQGYDLVSYHTGKPQRGNGLNVAVYKDVSYIFINEENKKTFEADPEKYIPAYGGYCAYGIAAGKKFDTDPEVWKIVDGKLYLNTSPKFHEKWEKDIPGNIKKADSKWKEIKDKSPSDL
jgi:hypothetical protein